MTDHAARVAAEIERYRRPENIHELPAIFHYWSRTFLRPHLAKVFASDNLWEIFAAELARSIRTTGNENIVSIGAGDAAVEMLIAPRLIDAGVPRFRFHCLDLNPHPLARGRAAADEAGLGEHFDFAEVDLSAWRADRVYGAAFANHSLHHIDALEHVFSEVRDNLAPQGAFVISDMIGRNGHMRWPETLAVIERLWGVIPGHYKFHHRFGRVVDPYDNWDCSTERFEGIRAQDIMPELIKRFHFRKMCVWGGVLDPFIDRGYGHNLDPASAEDTAFIDRLWAMDCALLDARASSPTQIVATVQKAPCQLEASSFRLTPEECVRRP